MAAIRSRLDRGNQIVPPYPKTRQALMIKHTFLWFLIAFSFLTTGLAEAQVPKPEKVKINLYTSVSAVAPGQSFNVIIEQLIEPEWHTYWLNPGDSGTPTTAEWDLPDGGQAGALQFPTPIRIPYGPLVNFGYSQRALFIATITPPDTLKTETYRANAKLEWLVCKDICIPEGDIYTITLPVAPKPIANEADADIMHDAMISQPVAVDWPATYAEQDGNFVLTVMPGGQGANMIADGAETAYFPNEWGLFKNAAEQVLVKTDDANGQIMLVMPRDTRALSEIGDLPGILTLSSGTGEIKGFMITAKSTIPHTAAQPPTLAPKPSVVSRTSLLVAITMALLGGLILNLMPCVFPVLFLKVLSIAKLPDAERAHARAHGLAYMVGVIVTFLTVASLLMILQQGGAAIGWGFQLQQPIIIACLVYLFILIGLNLMGWFEIDLNRFLPSRVHGNQDGLTGSLATGVLATLVATPCTAPFMGVAMAYALTHHWALGLAVFAALGLGLALPFVTICFVPKLQRALPRPGTWMLTLRQVLAFPMFLAAIWLVWVIAQQTGANGVALTLLGILSLIFFIWLVMRPFPTQGGRKLVRGLLLMLTLIGLGLLTAAQNTLATTPMATTMGEVAYSPNALDTALKKDGPILVNMTAAWCITCKINEQVALHSNRVRDLFAQHHVTYIKGDWTNYDPNITTYLAQFDRQGVPLYIYYGPRDMESGVRPDPVVLPQLLTPTIIEQTLTKRKIP